VVIDMADQADRGKHVAVQLRADRGTRQLPIVLVGVASADGPKLDRAVPDRRATRAPSTRPRSSRRSSRTCLAPVAAPAHAVRPVHAPAARTPVPVLPCVREGGEQSGRTSRRAAECGQGSLGVRSCLGHAPAAPRIVGPFPPR
jgi:hypothetical protein